ncbi:MAG: hypothetical protein IJV18_13230 [Acidaminococcaceae bacterium]|nr:hypothetical protein [Acidaminococcaceae bacterium]
MPDKKEEGTISNSKCAPGYFVVPLGALAQNGYKKSVGRKVKQFRKTVLALAEM